MTRYVLALAGVLLALACPGLHPHVHAQHVGIGTATPHPSALLEVLATDRGLRIPRLTQVAIDALGPTPPAGLLVYNLDSNCLSLRNDTAWVLLCADEPCPLKPTAVASGNTAVCVGSTLYLSAQPVEEAAYYWTGPGGFERFVPSPSRAAMTLADAGNYILRTYRFGCFSDPDTLVVSVGTTAPYTTCQAILAANPGSPSGIYSIDPDGAGALCPMACYCDMTTDGGGWTLVLNYLHQGGTNPVTQARTTDLPLLGSTTLGDNEAATAFWGHAAPALQNAIPHTELRFWARTGAHARVIHFKTSHAGTLAYFRTGTGSVSGIQASFTALAGHTAFLPASANAWFTNQGVNAMVNFPMYLGGTYHWGIRGAGGRWEVDDYPNNATQNTHHQIWVR